MIEKFDPTKDQPVSFSQRALTHFAAYLSQKGGIGLRISVKTTGCSGLSYVIESVEKVPSQHISMTENKLTFYIDCKALPYINGLFVDYVKKDLGLCELVYHNPNAAAYCGCGESFTIDKS